MEFREAIISSECSFENGEPININSDEMQFAVQRKCHKCGVSKELKEFRVDRLKSENRGNICKKCHSQNEKERYHRNKKEMQKQ